MVAFGNWRLQGMRQAAGAHVPSGADPGRGAMDWDDVRVFLAVAREGSMRAAGRALGLSQPTIARRLAAFEAGFGGQALFDRLPEGVRLNAAGEQLSLRPKRRAGDADVERRRAAASPVLSGTVRVSTGECAAGFLARCLSGSTRAALPSGITLELVESTADGQPRAPRGRYGAAPPAARKRRFLCRQGGHFAVAVYRRRGAEAAPGWPIPRSKHSTRRRAGSNGRSKRPECRWRCVPRRC